MFVPEYYPKIIELIRSADWLVHNFHAENVDIYNAVDYQHNRQVEGIKYQVILDMNFLQYLLNMVKRPESNELSRIAAAYLTFFQISDIQLDPTCAIYEKINYSGDRADEAISNLEQFRGIDNHSLDDLAAYALGYEQQLRIEPIASNDREKLREALLQYRRLTDWDSLYLCVLAITDISNDTSISRPKKLLAFVEWCIAEFRFSLAALVYAAALFGRAPVKKMMKYKAKDQFQIRRAALSNMAWDLYYVDRYMKSWVSKDERTENFMLTADGGLKLTMQLAVECQLAEGIEPFRPHLANELQRIEAAYANRHSVKRAYKSEEWSYDYRDSLITKYESKLLKVET
jgi:hypothetical protein